MNPHFHLVVSEEFAPLKAGIVDVINRRVFGNRIVNARERRELRFVKEVQLSADFQELWARIKHRTRYRVHFETAALVEPGAFAHPSDGPDQAAADGDDRRGGRRVGGGRVRRQADRDPGP